MNITNNTVNSSNFKGRICTLKELKAVMPETKVSKGLTLLDAAAFRQYTESIKYRMGVTPDEIEQLNKYEGNEFLINSYKLILKKMGIPEELAPVLNIVDNIAGDSEMGYMPVTNLLLYDISKIKNNSKAANFGLLRHECQHYIQNMSVLRHETLGEKAVEEMTENYVNLEKNSVNNLINNFSDEQREELFAENPKVLEYIKNIKQCIETGDTESYNLIFDKIGEEYKLSLLNLQKNIRSKMGIIPAKSSLTPKIEKYYNELFNSNYNKESSEIDYSKYFAFSIETEAISAQTAANNEYLYKNCPITNSKNTILECYEDENFINRINNDFSQAK